MKLVLKIFCIITAIYCFYFPFTYFKSIQDKKEVKLSHILVDSEDKAKEIRQNIIDKKYKFADAAKEHSLCPSAKQNGDIGYNPYNKLLKEIADFAFNHPKFVLSNPIKTKEGWHIVRIYDIKYFSDKENFVRRY